MSLDAIPDVSAVDGKGIGGPGGSAAGGENPYLSARRHWNSQTERAFSAARLWQLYGTAGLLAAFASVAGWIYVASQPRFIPYVVEVSQLGEAVAVKPASAAVSEDVRVRVIRAQVAAFIRGSRMVAAEVAVERKYLLQVWSMLRSKDPATAKIREWWDEHKKADPLSRAATETVDVEIVSTLPVSDNAWQVDWRESVSDRDGALKESYPMRATLTIYTAPTDRRATEEELNANPLGVYVRDLSWTRL